MKIPLHIEIPNNIIKNNDINNINNINNKKCIGENGHIQYGWSNEIREKILQFYLNQSFFHHIIHLTYT